MKAILMSIKPEWVEKILNGEKTIEIRKTMPKCELPRKVYIYCTKQGRPLVYGDVQCNTGFIEKYTQTYNYSKQDVDRIWGNLQGKVVATFTLNKIDQFGYVYSPSMFINEYRKIENDTFTNEIIDYKKCCISPKELAKCAKDGKLLPKPIFAWHIDDLKIYDEPKLLQEFFKPCDGCEKLGTDRCTNEISYCRAKTITRPPQSWFYVGEEV